MKNFFINTIVVIGMALALCFVPLHFLIHCWKVGEFLWEDILEWMR